MNLHFQFKSIALCLFILGIQQSRIKAVPQAPDEGYDCTKIFAEGSYTSSGPYLAKPIKSLPPFLVFCENRSDGGWTVIQRRNGRGADGHPVSFYRPWLDYKNGFGDVKCEHWLGLDHIHALTHQEGKTCQLRVDMIDCQNQQGYALYDNFSIDSEKDLYRLHLGKYEGDRGDAFRANSYSKKQDGYPFSTYDNDNDGCDPCIRGDIAFYSCAETQASGWWYSDCGLSDLNGDWHNQTECIGWASAISWDTWSSYRSLLSTEMKVKCT
ncbi:fibrinogen-like protein 1 [Anolis carolinensis]|uniref:fibrinogen-like protein 1 n=1 Tax=Anolis carolinensis TaxID=28377 RepID=UPI0002039784